MTSLINQSTPTWRFKLRGIALLLAVLPLMELIAPANSFALANTSNDLNNPILRDKINQIKTAPRGPFGQIRWFCADGSILPPKPYACSQLGGGKQHGEWTAEVKAIRASGLPIANIYAELNDNAIKQLQANPEDLAFLLLERYLINTDDGWIFRNAYSYRGALQMEDEILAVNQLLSTLLASPTWRDRHFLLLRDAFKLLPRDNNSNVLPTIRQDAITLAETDPRYAAMRNKLHNQLEPADINTLRTLATETTNAAISAQLEALAVNLETFFKPTDVSPLLAKILPALDSKSPLFKILIDYKLGQQTGTVEQETLAKSLLAVRRAISQQPLKITTLIKLFDLSLAIEQQLLAVQASITDADRKHMTRLQHLQNLQQLTYALYGSGLIDSRALDYLSLDASLATANPSLSATEYREHVDRLARIPSWATGSLRLNYQPAIDAMTTLEPQTTRFIDDALRASLALPYAKTLDLLAKDVSHLSGVSHQLFGKKVDGGFLRLNPGLTRGQLFAVDANHIPDSRHISLVTDPSLELPSVAGILSGFDGNQLSHLQLLARNLGIPNVVISPKIVKRLQPYTGRSLVYAASPGGVVVIAEDGPEWDEWFPKQAQSDVVIRPDLNKLDLKTTQLIPLKDLRASDSGRIVGPKAAKLGELKQLFPDAVTEGIAIPFGVFNQLLQKPINASGQSTIDYMREQYQYIASLEKNSEQQKEVIKTVLQTLRNWFLTVPMDPAFEQQLHAAMAATFGKNTKTGVFVRSDTNVEDLPGFTGAGLNLTIPNVIGYDATLKAMRQVWASPFSERAYSWRQALMPTPEHVYTAILLLQSVDSERSGVLVTADADSNDRQSVTIAANEGVGGAVENQAAEVIVVRRADQNVQLLQPASAARKKSIAVHGGLVSLPSSKKNEILSQGQIKQLLDLTELLPSKFPEIVDAAGNVSPADVEFGFIGNKLVLFQIRPFLQNKRALQNRYLTQLDQQYIQHKPVQVDLLKPIQGK